MHLTRRTLVEWTLSAGALAIVASAIVAMDTRVRDYARDAVGHGGSAWNVSQSVMTVARSARDLCLDHQPLAAFTAVGLMLVLFMRRMR